ncbi:MAG: GNAT family N-acetyltransferase [Phycisphaerales bacterium]|nr:GNAT family N-acetyltransferase [Phycisphaerales bacterium]
MITIRSITTDDVLYRQECDLRESVLLRPIGMDMAALAAEFPGFEERFEHFVALLDHPTGERVIGCVTLLPGYPQPRTGKLMQMCVDAQRQGEGIGRRLVAALERRAFGELGLSSLYCHAQLTACGFYHNLGWVSSGPVFDEGGVAHQKMLFEPPPAED